MQRSVELLEPFKISLQINFSLDHSDSSFVLVCYYGFCRFVFIGLANIKCRTGASTQHHYGLDKAADKGEIGQS